MRTPGQAPAPKAVAAGTTPAGAMPAPLPVLLLSGALGAGKTTLVNHLLRQAGGRRIAVLVNDFGETPIDADLILDPAAERRDGEGDSVLVLAGGCLCCSFGDDLVGTLGRVARRRSRPDLVLIEASGVAEPLPLARSIGLQTQVRLAAVWTVVDVPRLPRLLADLYMGDVVQAQLQAADGLLLNKADGLERPVDPGAADALAALLDRHAPHASQWPSPVQALPAELMLDMLLAPDAPPPAVLTPSGGMAAAEARWAARPMHRPGAAHHAPRFEARESPLPPGTDLAALGQALAAAGVLRAKALAHDAAGQRWLLQVVGEHWQLSPNPSPNGADRLVWIAPSGRMSEVLRWLEQWLGRLSSPCHNSGL